MYLALVLPRHTNLIRVPAVHADNGVFAGRSGDLFTSSYLPLCGTFKFYVGMAFFSFFFFKRTTEKSDYRRGTLYTDLYCNLQVAVVLTKNSVFD